MYMWFSWYGILCALQPLLVVYSKILLLEKKSDFKTICFKKRFKVKITKHGKKKNDEDEIVNILLKHFSITLLKKGDPPGSAYAVCASNI